MRFRNRSDAGRRLASRLEDLRGKDAVIVTDPFDRGLGLELPRPRADIVTVSRNEPLRNAVGLAGITLLLVGLILESR